MMKKSFCLIMLSMCLSGIATAGLPVIKDGWDPPLTFSTRLNSHSVFNVGDIDGDGDMEIFIGKPMASLYQFYQHDGTKLCEYEWGAHNWIQAALYDFDGDGREEIVLGGHGCACSFQRNYTAVLKWDGAEWTKCGGWNQSAENSVGYGYAVADLDNDGEVEIVTSCCAHGAINVWNFAGEKKQGFPTARNQDQSSYFCPMVRVGDITGDGNLEIVHTHRSNIRVVRSNGDCLSGWPRNGLLYGIVEPGQGCERCCLADINNDGKCEIIYRLRECEASSLPNRVAAWQADGSNLPGWPCEVPFFIPAHISAANPPPIAGDMDGDGKLEVAMCIIAAGSDYVCLIDSAGNLLWEKKEPELEDFDSCLVMGDIDGDGVQELIGCSNTKLYAWHKDGSNAPGFPMTIDLGSDEYWDWDSHEGRIILEDIDNDGKIEMLLGMAPCGGSKLNYFVVYDCDTVKEPGAIQWGYKFFNRRNTCCYEKP